MAELEMEGYTLGQKHHHYNILVQEAIRNNKIVNVDDFNLEDSDVINLQKIDIASHSKNVQYILKVLACNDMLYVSRAIKKSGWLINNQNYAHIINPKYFHTNLFPQMCSKAIIKLVKYIRNTLNDEKRAEEFYHSEENSEEAVKWLPCCSLEFIQQKITNHIPHVKTALLVRLCKKSITVLEIYMKDNTTQNKRKALQATIFLLSSDTDRYLDIVEANEFPNFNKKATTILMERKSNRVREKFDKYYNFVHLPTFIRYLKKENIKNFLLDLAQNMNNRNLYRFCHLKRLLLFIRFIPQDIRFEFVKEVFINKTHESKETCILSENERKGMSILYNTLTHLHHKHYIWYQFAPFNITFEKIQDSIGSVSSITDKIDMLEIILISAQNNLSHELIFLEYLRDKQKNAEHKLKKEILTKLILKKSFIRYDIKTWDVLDDIFKTMDIYTESKNSERVFIEAIILYNVIHKRKVLDIVENKFNFDSLLPYHKKLLESEREMVFNYLYDLIMIKLSKYNTTNEKEFKEKIDCLELVLQLLRDFKKELKSYPSLLCIIKDLVKIKNDLYWTVSMETLFNIKKTWRKLFFEDSFTFHQTESVLLNCLKHGPSLLEKNKNVVKKILCNDKTQLRHVLGKIKIYWPSSLAKNLTVTYKEELNVIGDHRAVTRGLSILLQLKHLQDLIGKYTPKEAKVDWANIDEVELSIQQNFAKNMHICRPQPSPETIIQFAKGDYLQYALPSLLSIFYNLNVLYSQKYIPILLDAPVSLQKHGIRLAVSKFNFDELLFNISNIWQNNKNASIRSVIFKNVYELLCKEKDSNKIKSTWELIKIFIDTITFHEDKAIYDLLFNVKNVPLEVRGQFYMKSYVFLHKLLHSSDEYQHYEQQFYTNFTEYSKEIIEQLQPSFVTDIILEFIAKEFTKKQTEKWSRGCVISVISSYLLCAPNEQTQLDRYDKVLLPVLKQTFSLWNTEDFIRYNLKELLNTLRFDIKQYVIGDKKVIPSKMFLFIQEELKNILEIPDNYMLLTKWKLTTTFTAILDAHTPIFNWEEACVQVAHEFGKKCTDYLREDCKNYFPDIYLLFAKALNSLLCDFISPIAHWNIYRNLIHDESFTAGYLAAIILISNTWRTKHDVDIEANKNNFQDLCKNIWKHPSIEIKMHYYNRIEKIK